MIATLISRAVAKNPALLPLQIYWPLIKWTLIVVTLFGLGYHWGGKEAEGDLEEFKRLQAMATSEAVTQLNSELVVRNAELGTMRSEHAIEMADLHRQLSDRPIPSVRVCLPRRTDPVPSVPTTERGGPTDSRGEPELPGGMGFDIGPGTERLVRRAEVVLEKCLNQQERTDYLSSQKPYTVPVKR